MALTSDVSRTAAINRMLVLFASVTGRIDVTLVLIGTNNTIRAYWHEQYYTMLIGTNTVRAYWLARTALYDAIGTNNTV